MMSDIKERLRSMVQKMRRTPVPIIDLVPMFQEAADHIATLEQESAANLQRALVAEKDAARYKILRDGNGYAPEENCVRGGEELDDLCDELIGEKT